MTVPSRRWIVGIGIVALAAAAVRPLRFTVDGSSMAPGLRSGDTVSTGLFPWGDRVRTPRRFERWVLVAGDGTDVIKRVAGLPGERISISGGDLAADGKTVLKGPAVLAEVASPVTGAVLPKPAAASGAPSAVPGWQWSRGPREIVDDDAVGDDRTRLLVPVTDAGIAAVVLVRRLTDAGFVRVRVRVGPALLAWRLRAPGRFAIVAGHLDGHLVAAAWPLAARTAAGARSCLPAAPPAAWDVARTLAPAESHASTAPLLAIDVGDAEAGGASQPVVLEEVVEWRDMLHRPAADGVESWRLGADEFFVLGDFPSASRDSRHWGASPAGAFRHPVR